MTYLSDTYVSAAEHSMNVMFSPLKQASKGSGKQRPKPSSSSAVSSQFGRTQKIMECKGMHGMIYFMVTLG